MSKYFFILVLGLFTFSSLMGAIFYVDDDGGQDFTTIQAGFTSPLVHSGDTLYVYPGDNYGPLSIGNRGLYIQAYQTTGIEISDDDTDVHCIKFTSSCNEPTYFVGFSITGGDDTNGGGVYAGVTVNRSIYFDKCEFTRNSATNGGAMYFSGTDDNCCHVFITNSEFELNSASS
ncbi:MAG: hypothetical protein K9M99_04425 [Candidatus Cloacimonetes bacterium]|nr:hypothetical protein [Candidatus Cloacimonadota bacterium]